MSSDSGSPAREIPADVPHGLRSKSGLLDPFPWYSEKRSTSPVQYDDTRGVYDVFRFEDVKEILHAPDRFARPNLSAHGMTDETDDPLSYFETAMFWSDGPDHDTMKQNMFEYFTPAALEHLKPTIESITESQLESVVPADQPFDFVDEFAVPVTLKIPMELFGIPERDYGKIVEWIERFDQVSISEHSDAGSSSPEQMRDAVEYFDTLIEKRERNPQDDLLSTFIHETPLDRERIGANCFDMLFAGQGTMTDFLSNAIYLDATEGIFGTDATADMETVIEEVFRYRSPIQCQSRTTTEPVQLRETRIPAGETVVTWIGSANRDPERFDDPEQFEPARDPDHLAFGHGSHSCIGFTLARLEARVILDVLYDRVDDIELVEDEIRPAPTPQLLAFEELPVLVDS